MYISALENLINTDVISVKLTYLRKLAPVNGRVLILKGM